MKILLIGGTHPRHLYYMNAIAARFNVCGALLQVRAGMLPDPPKGTHPRDVKLWRRHFGNRAVKEMQYFGEQSMPGTQLRLVQGDALNTATSAEFVASRKPGAVLIFGCGMVREPLLSALPEHTYNLHLGLSPRYRGAATLFWPFYFLEPNWAGVTLHRIVHEPDAGAIAHQSRPELKRGDTIHDVGCRAVVQATRDALLVIDKLKRVGGLELHKQTATGKNFLAADFQPAHLRTIYETFDDKIVDAYLDGVIRPSEPKLRTQG